MGPLDVSVGVSECNAAMDVIDIIPGIAYEVVISGRNFQLTVTFSMTNRIYLLISVLEMPC